MIRFATLLIFSSLLGIGCDHECCFTQAWNIRSLVHQKAQTLKEGDSWRSE